MGQTISKVRTLTLDVQRFVPVLRYKRICRDLQAEIEQVKVHNEELQAQNKQLTLNEASFEKDKMKQSMKIHELSVENQQFRVKFDSIATSKVLNEELLVMREQISKIEQQTSNRRSPVDIGDQGEQFVFNCLQEAFPNNTGIIRNIERNCGDIMLRVENSSKVLMFEVKNISNRSVSGFNNGRDIQKFFYDLESSQYHGGVLLALNSPVDINVPQLVPQLHKGKPYVYVDKMKDSRDPVCLMQLLVSMMTFMINFASDLENNHPQLQLNHYSRQNEELKKLFEKLLRSNANQGKILDSIKAKLIESKTSDENNKASHQISDELQSLNIKEVQLGECVYEETEKK